MDIRTVDIRTADARIADIRFARPVEVLSEETFFFRILFLLRSLGVPRPREWSVATGRHGLFATASTAACGRGDITASFHVSDFLDSRLQLTMSRPASVVKVDVPLDGEGMPIRVVVNEATHQIVPPPRYEAGVRTGLLRIAEQLGRGARTNDLADAQTFATSAAASARTSV